MVKLQGGERGQALVLMAFALVALLIVVGLALDGGMVFLDRRRMQNATDAASLAGTRELSAAMCGSETAEAADALVYEAVVNYAKSNGVVAASDIVATYVKFDGNEVVEFDPPVSVGNSLEGGDGVPDGAAGVAVIASIERSTHLISLVGIDKAGASAFAEAVTGPLLAAGGGLPIIMDVDLVGELGAGQEFDLEFCSPGSTCQVVDINGVAHPAHRGWLNLAYIYNAAEASDFPRCVDNSGDSNALKTWIEEGNNVAIYAGSIGGKDGDFIHSIPGQKNSALQAICPGYVDKLIYIPLFDRVVDKDYMDDNFEEPASEGWPSQGGAEFYHVVGFVGFIVRSCNTQGSVKSITGEFVGAIIGAGTTAPNAGFNNNICSGEVMVVTLVE